MISKNQIKYIRSLEHKKYRDKYGVFVAEGKKLIDDLRSHFELVDLYEGEDACRASFQETPQGMLAVFRQAEDSTPARFPESELCLALDNIQNPGNMGTIIRLADWFGITHIYCSHGCADIYNPKVVQATMGSMARVRVHYLDLPTFISSLTDTPVYGTFLDGESIYTTPLSHNGLIVMGNEGHGVSDAVASRVTHKLLIPSYPPERPTGESLNVAIATSIVCAEFRRRSMNIVGKGVDSLHKGIDSVNRSIKAASKLCAFLLPLLFFLSCSVDRYVADDQLYLKEVDVVELNPRATKHLSLADYVLQQPNNKWFGAKVPLKIYCLGGVDSTNWATHLFHKIGQKPVIYDPDKALRTTYDMRQVLHNEGYVHAKVEVRQQIKGKKLSLTYEIDPGEQYRINSIRRNIADSTLAPLICGADTLQSLLRQGMPFNINRLNEERNRITSNLRNIGYYKFNKEYITFTADTSALTNNVDITMNIGLHIDDGRSEPELHRRYKIGKIKYYIDGAGLQGATSTEHTTSNGASIFYSDRMHFRPRLLTSNTIFNTGDYFNENDQKLTYRYLTRLGAVSYTNIRMDEESDTVVSPSIIINHTPTHSLNIDLEGTNSAGDLGVAASTSITHKNLFHGSEALTLKLRGAYEAITGLEGYDGHNYTEFGAEATLAFPGFLLPIVSKKFGATHSATSEISLQYNLQNRPEFRRRVLTAAWRYRWAGLGLKTTHRFDLLEVNYVKMPWISRTFREQYLDSLGKTNAILKYNYENLLITKLGYTYAYNSLGTAATSTYGKNAITLKLNIETSGNALGLMTHLIDPTTNSEGQRTLLGIAYAQYAKADIDIARSVSIDSHNSLAFHFAFGLAYPYGNSRILPFEKRYFAGGANSVRGWSVRSLGPGKYNGADRGINFINQSGDIKLDLSLEYRAFLFWKLHGALFIDGGNIWTIRDYKDQPGGVFRFDEFYKQIAVAYGVGLRMNLDFFVIRFDAGMKAINPAYESRRQHYPFLHPNFDRDFTLHFAVGLPF